MDAIISGGYRVNSCQAPQFRIWATQMLRKFIIKGFVLDDERLKAKLRIHMQTADGPKENSITVKQGADLFALSDERACCKNGLEVAEIDAELGSEFIRLSSGRTLRLGEEVGGLREEVWRAISRHEKKISTWFQSPNHN